MYKIIECPRDAMQGINDFFIDTQTKADYINKLIRVGFHTIDFGSFVSPKAIPQMRDTEKVLEKLNLQNNTRLLAIVANERGALDACQFEQISYLGYPFSVSETFQQRNTNASIQESLGRLKGIQKICKKHSKQLVVYISMGFGNPYGDPWNVQIVQRWVDFLAELGIKIMSLSDTIGIANKASIEYLFGNLIPPYPDVEFGAHFHTTRTTWREKVEAAFKNGCKRFDAALKGYGGCPMAKDELTGNMPTELLIQYFNDQKIELGLDVSALQESMKMTHEVFEAMA